MHELNPRLVILSITGFGHDGPEGGRAGYDQIAQGEAGLMSIKVVTAALTHYSLTGLYDEVIGVPKLRDAATAPLFAAAFGLAVGP